MYEANDAEAPARPSYLVFDARFRKSYPVGPLGPGRMQPDSAIGRRLKGFLKKSGSLEGLAEKLGVDPAGLKQTIDVFNENSLQDSSSSTAYSSSIVSRSKGAGTCKGGGV